MKHKKWVLILFICLAACNGTGISGPEIDSTPMPATETDSQDPITNSNATDTPATQSSATFNDSGNDAQPGQKCPIGLGLREETTEVLLKHKTRIGFVMSANSLMAEEYFEQFEGSIRVIGAPSLDVLKEKGERANVDALPYEALGYGLETGSTTPDTEWQDLVGSTTTAKAVANDLNKLLVMGPGFKLMSNNEDMYAPMAASTDIWLLQTQQLQKDPPGDHYRAEVERIVELIRSGNPDIAIWAQITLPPDRVPDAGEWLEYRSQILDLVDGTYIGVYTWEVFDQKMLIDTIETVIETACEDQ